MYKFLIATALVLSTSAALSFEHLQIDSAFKTQDLVKMKLWYEGVESSKPIKTSKAADLPEELLVPLSKFKF